MTARQEGIDNSRADAKHRLPVFVCTMHLIAAFDPGETTGVCIGAYAPERDVLQVLLSTSVPYGRRHQALTDLFTDYAFTHVVIEDFRLYRGKAMSKVNSTFPTVRVIGVLEYLSWQAGLQPTYQMAVVRKRAQVLPEHTAVIGSMQHRIDSYQHMRYYVVTQLRK